VDADVIVAPFGTSRNIGLLSGLGISDRYAEILPGEHSDVVADAVPVAMVAMKIGGQDQMVAGVDSDRLDVLTGGRQIVAGRVFDPEGRFSTYLSELLMSESAAGDDEIVEPQLKEPGRSGLEMVIDSRLARSASLGVGDHVEALAHRWKIVGIVETGGIARVYVPRRTLQWLLDRSLMRSSLLFVRLAPGAKPVDLAAAIRQSGYPIESLPLEQYRATLRARFATMYRYVDAVNAVSLVIAFLFIMITLYTMVLQQTREIAILKSFGADNWFVLRQMLAESLLLTGLGTMLGIAMAFAAAWLIQTLLPLYTVTITADWIAIAVGAALVGALFSALYPAWRATRVDMVSALTLE
jgi:putative ABC transport system permease protein